VGSRVPLARLEEIIDASGVAPAIEALLPAGARHRQLRARTMLLGMQLALDDRRPAYLTEIHAALTSLPEADQPRLGVTEDWHGRPHQLTYRQVEHTCRLITKALGKDQPDGAPSQALAAFCDRLLEASIPARNKQASRSLAADWTDVETWSRPPRHGSTECADPEAAWGHRTTNLPGPRGEMFFGYYLSDAVMTREEDGPPVPELARRMTVCSCHLDPVRALAPVLTAMPAHGIPLGDIIDDSGYAHRDAKAWAIPLRRAGAQLVQDLHPHDRGPHGTHHGAIIANGNLYCPQTPRTLLELAPLPPGAAPETVTVHNQQTAELARHKLGRHTGDDADGYHRATCPAARRTTGLLHPADHHHPPARGSQDPAKARLPISAVAALLPAAHRRRTRLFHHQGPRHHQHRPRLVPPYRPGPAHTMDRLPADHPQPANRRCVPGPPGRQHPPRRRRPAPALPQTAPHQPRRTRRRAAITGASSPRHGNPAAHHSTSRPGPAHPKPGTNEEPKTRRPGHDHTDAGKHECRTQM
jgi:hypothetical protein